MQEARYFLVRAEVLPEVLRRTMRAKELLSRGEAKTVNQAVAMAGVSRSAFYKYRDAVFPFTEAAREKVITLSLILEHRSGILARILNAIAAARGNIRTISQVVPVEGLANVSVSFETAGMDRDVETVLDCIRQSEGVRKAELISHD